MSKIYRKLIIVVVLILVFLWVIIRQSNIFKTDEVISYEKNEWTITQYSSPSGYQAMFYIIKDKTGRITVVDGGYREDADYVKDILLQEGKEVDNWIITHPHPDHVGAFNYICENYSNEVKINHIYAVEMDYDKYKEKAKDWDVFSEYESFLDVSKKLTNLTYVRDGDEYNVDGLKMKVFNAYSEKTNELSDDLANDGSMMFKIWGNEESMLFCADVGYRISDKIISDYKVELQSNYLQMGHHGNGGLTDEFYEYVKPQGAFFDAPDWLMKNIKPDSLENGKWDTPENITLMQDMSATIYGFPTAPNSITLK